MKSFTHEDVRTCQRALDRGIPVVLDLCDNIFIDDYAEGRNLDYSPGDNFRTMAAMAAAIVTTGPALQQAIADQIEHGPPVWIIPDGCETLEDVHHALAAGDGQRYLDILRYSPVGIWTILEIQGRHCKKGLTRQVKHQQARVLRWWHRIGHRGAALSTPTQLPSTSSQPAAPGNPRLVPRPADQGSTDPSVSTAPRKTVLWFGNHGTSYGQVGIENLLEVSPALDKLNQQIPLQLKVVSNSYSKYLQLIAPLPFPTEYVEWHPTEVYHHISTSDVVIIPNSKSPFSICKSANRAVLALSLGVPVVATQTPALHPLTDCILFDDWASGLRRYLSQPDLVKAHILQAQTVIESTYSSSAIAEQWLRLLEELQKQRHGHPEAFSNAG